MSTKPSATMPYVKPSMKPRNTYWSLIAQPPMVMARTFTSCSRSAQEHRVKELFVIEQFASGPRELHLSAFHVDSAISDGQRDVDRLLDDDHGQAFGLESLDDGKQLLDYKRREAE